MICQRLLSAGLFVAAFCGVFANRDAAAGDYVWARSGWGNGSWGRNYSGMSNGYGGYYVPRNAYGNNHESRQPFRNPNGYIVPTDVGGNSVNRQCNVPVVPMVPAQPTHVPQLAVPPQASSLPPKANNAVPNSTIPTSPTPSSSVLAK